MANMIPFSAKVPAHIRKENAKFNDDLISSGGGFPVMSIKGKTFSVKRGGERTTLTRPDDPDTPAAAIEVVILRTQTGLSKTYYISGYTEGANTKPDCSSADGVRPDAGVPHPQAKSCAACPHNQFGSKLNEKGVATKGKACQDVKRLAIAAAGTMADPMLLRVPPDSLKNLTEFAKVLKGHGAKYNEVVTKISFDMQAATPKLLFKPVGYLDADGCAEALEQYNTDVVQQIIGLIEADEEFDTPTPTPTPTPEAPAAKVAAAEEPAADTADTEAADESVGDPAPAEVAEEAAAAATEAKKPAKKKAADPIPEIDDAGLDELLSEFDD